MATVVTSFTTINGMLVHEDRGGVETEYVSDSLGSLVQSRNSSGTKTYDAQYWPYGELQTSTGTNPSSWGYVGLLGYLIDSATMLYVRARYLMTKFARWLNVDPLWPRELAYDYVRGLPVLFIDPTGMVCGGSSNPGQVFGPQFDPKGKPKQKPKLPPQPAPTCKDALDECRDAREHDYTFCRDVCNKSAVAGLAICTARCNLLIEAPPLIFLCISGCVAYFAGVELLCLNACNELREQWRNDCDGIYFTCLAEANGILKNNVRDAL